MTYCVFFDLETGGVEPHHPTIQLGAVAVEQASGREVSCFEQKILFDVATADPKALEINGYTADAWQTAQPPRVTAAKFAAWLKPYSSVTMTSKRTGGDYQVAQLAGYNALTFDLPRLKAMFGTDFFPCSYLVRDVLQRALFYFDERPNLPKPDNFKLATVAAYFDLNVDGAHDALADARMSAAIAMRLREDVALGSW